MAQKKTQAQFEAEVIALYGTKYDLSKVVYTDTHTAVEVVCPEHGSFFPTPKNLLNGKACRACGLKAGGQGRTNKLRIEFEAKAAELGYTPQPTDTWNSRVRVPLVCPKHGDFTCYPHTALHKNSWCPACGRGRAATTLTTTKEAWLVKAEVVHGGVYTYIDLPSVIGTKTHVRAVCPAHGIIALHAGTHIKGAKCGKCASDAVGKKRAKSAAGLFTDLLANDARFAKVEMVDKYTACKAKTKFNCEEHGDFVNTPDNMRYGSMCPGCVGRSSTQELSVLDFVKQYALAAPQARIGGKEIDIYLPEHKLAIEFNGELFHADTNPYSPTPNPKGKTKHREKEDACAAAGVRLIQLWGSQWENRRPVIERLLLSAIGKDPAPLVGGRECMIDPEVPFREAMEFYEANHPQGKGTSNAKNWGLRHKKTGQLVACMSFSTTADRRGAAATSWAGASLTRYATSHRVPGGASKLLNAWRKANHGMAVMSYSDPMLFAGKTYATLGFTAVKRLDPDYLVFVTKERKLYHKSAFQRKNLEKWRVALKCDDVGAFDPATDTRTEFQMEDAMGVKRVWNTGLIRWELPPV